MAMGQFWRFPTLLLLLALFSPFSIAELPQELDPFLERLFETTECEKFLADGSFLAVATRECPPNRCEFPHQLCMRPSAEYQKEEANQCRALPEACLLAANGGQPLPKFSAPSPTTSPALTVDSQSPPPPPPPLQPAPQPVDRPAVEKPPQPTATLAPNIQVGNIRPQPPPPPPTSHGPICEQGPPEGRFCGFSLKFAYNRETRSCDQFWFPGCRTERTNENLFDTFAQCLQASRHCARADPIYRPQPSIGGRPSPPDSTAFGGGGNGQFLGGGSQLPPPSPQQPIGPIHQQTGQPETPFGQAGQFLRLISNTIREVRERGNGAAATGNGQQQGGGGGGFRFDPSQLGGILQSLGGRRK